MHGLMNAYTASRVFDSGFRLRPQWKTLTLLGPSQELLGQIRYVRHPQSQMEYTCQIMLPADFTDRLSQVWARMWFEQRGKQIELTDA